MIVIRDLSLDTCSIVTCGQVATHAVDKHDAGEVLLIDTYCLRHAEKLARKLNQSRGGSQ